MPPIMPHLTYQKGALSSAGAEGTSSKVCQASPKKYFKIPNSRACFFKKFDAKQEWLAQNHARCKVVLEPGVCF